MMMAHLKSWGLLPKANVTATDNNSQQIGWYSAEKNGFLPYTVHNIRFAEKKVNNKIESTVLSKAH